MASQQPIIRSGHQRLMSRAIRHLEKKRGTTVFEKLKSSQISYKKVLKGLHLGSSLVPSPGLPKPSRPLGPNPEDDSISKPKSIINKGKNR
jgi:hypothetical protein